MKKLLITLIATAAFAIPFLAAHSTYDDGPNYHRGCVASAYQATTNGFEANLEANLAECYGQSVSQ